MIQIAPHSSSEVLALAVTCDEVIDLITFTPPCRDEPLWSLRHPSLYTYIAVNMLLPTLAVSLLPLTSARSYKGLGPPAPNLQYVVSNPPLEDESYKIPTIHESAIMARRIMHLSTLGTLVTSFPHSSSSSEDPSTLENRPNAVEGSPIGLMEYYADCEHNGNPTLLAINIATPFKNYEAGSNISLSIRWWPKASNIYSSPFTDDYFHGTEIPTPHTPAALPRLSLHGHLERISREDLLKKMIPALFLRAHPDSILWQPGNDISHESEYVRLVVEYVYWFGGFGDRARIGWLPLEEWQKVTREEIEACRLPGEEDEKRKTTMWWRDWL